MKQFSRAVPSGGSFRYFITSVAVFVTVKSRLSSTSSRTLYFGTFEIGAFLPVWNFYRTYGPISQPLWVPLTHKPWSVDLVMLYNTPVNCLVSLLVTLGGLGAFLPVHCTEGPFQAPM